MNPLTPTITINGEEYVTTLEARRRHNTITTYYVREWLNKGHLKWVPARKNERCKYFRLKDLLYYAKRYGLLETTPPMPEQKPNYSYLFEQKIKKACTENETTNGRIIFKELIPNEKYAHRYGILLRDIRHSFNFLMSAPFSVSPFEGECPEHERTCKAMAADIATFMKHPRYPFYSLSLCTD